MQCLAFLGNGDVLTGDSGGVTLIWSKTTVEPTPGKGPKGTVFSCSSHSFLICTYWYCGPVSYPDLETELQLNTMRATNIPNCFKVLHNDFF